MERRWSALCAAVMAVQTFLLLFWAEAAPGAAFPGLGLSPAASGEVPAAVERPLPSETPGPVPTPCPEEVPDHGAAPASADEPVPEVTPFPDAETLLLNRTGFDPDPAALAAEPLCQRLPRQGTQILILHTHGTEAYSPVPGEEYAASDPYRTTDPTHSVIRVGDVLQQTLEARGLTVIHDRTLCDWPGYTGSYGRSEAVIRRALEEHPEIGIVIDLHRDALTDGDGAYTTVAHTENGAAQVMLVIGTGENGLEHPRWRENLKLALALQLAMAEACPGLARPIHLARERYNQHLSDGALILEVGTNGNTLSEAERAAEAFGQIAAPVFLSLRED